MVPDEDRDDLGPVVGVGEASMQQQHRRALTENGVEHSDVADGSEPALHCLRQWRRLRKSFPQIACRRRADQWYEREEDTQCARACLSLCCLSHIVACLHALRYLLEDRPFGRVVLTI